MNLKEYYSNIVDQHIKYNIPLSMNYSGELLTKLEKIKKEKEDEKITKFDYDLFMGEHPAYNQTRKVKKMRKYYTGRALKKELKKPGLVFLLIKDSDGIEFPIRVYKKHAITKSHHLIGYRASTGNMFLIKDTKKYAEDR